MKTRLISDIGGLPEGPLDLSEHEPTMTERRIDAMMMLLRAKPRSFWASDEIGALSKASNQTHTKSPNTMRDGY